MKEDILLIGLFLAAEKLNPVVSKVGVNGLTPVRPQSECGLQPVCYSDM